MRTGFWAITLGLVLSSCQTYNPMNDYELKEPITLHDVETISGGYPKEQVQKGKYLVALLACGTCHTNGALVGEPDPSHHLAGSRIGIAYSNPFVERNPGILYPANITPDIDTGIGAWSDNDLIRVLRTGVDIEGRRHIPVMPWPGYARMSDEDAKAVVAFLRSLKPVRYEVPTEVPPGKKAKSPYVHFGVYQSKR